MLKTPNIRILYASRLVPEKGVDILIDAIKTSSDHPLQIEWHIASNGPYERDVRLLAETYPSKVHYHGMLDRRALADLYRKSDFLFMPSRFLETFGLTALESLACGTPVIGFAKGGLIPFIPESLAIDPENPIESLFTILNEPADTIIDVSDYASSLWAKKLTKLFSSQNIILLHDYADSIGGAEVYVETVISTLHEEGKNISRYSFIGSTTPGRRRFFFIFSLFAFWRFFSVRKILNKNHPDIIWMHSVMRYIGFWGILAVRCYFSKNREVICYLSHHDIGLFAPFPEAVTHESEIPASFHLKDYLREVRGWRRIIASAKWCYVWLYRKVFPKDIAHIVFAPFMEKHIIHHFSKDARVIILPHSYDDTLFHR